MVLEGRAAVVTGAASGIGRGVAAALATAGARVAILDRDEAAARRTAEEITASGGPKAFAIACDVRASADVQRCFDDAEDRMGRIDVVVCAAGVREVADSLELAPEAWDQTIAVDLSGTFYCCQAGAKAMTRAGGGSILTISSVSGLVGEAQRPAYCAAKHGVIGLTKALATDLAKHRIRVNAICPGLIRTPLTEPYFADESFAAGLSAAVPLGTAGEPRHIGDVAVFLASDKAEYITGVALPVDGGFLADKPFAPPGSSAYFGATEA
jgi:NAD(P)-dependent dehydrogenase (short-subunit alcohol dehydrogenase family)